MSRSLNIALISLSMSGCARPARILDLHASFREIWQGSEQWSSGKEADVTEHVTLDLDSPASANAAGIVFSPLEGKACKDPIAAVAINQAAANSVELAPQSPLVRGCSYDFVVPETTQLARNGGHLVAPLRVRFRVTASDLTPAQRELVNVQSAPDTGSMGLFAARPGINTPVREALERYQDAIGIRASDLEPSLAGRDALESAPVSTQLYVQHHGVYVVSGYGYMISTRAGFFRSALGKVLLRLPEFDAPRLSESEALKCVTSALALAPPPWDVPGNHFRRPHGQLQLIRSPAAAAGASLVPVWGFGFENSNHVALSYIGIDVNSGDVVAKEPTHIVE